MTTSDVIAVIQKATSDDSFKQLLFTNPTQALKGYNLTTEEKALFNNLNDDKLEQLRGQWIPGG